jgi:hypothetical protein
MCGRVKLEGDFSQLKADDYPAPNCTPPPNRRERAELARDIIGLAAD